jgi:release factor glutamine methyltransferase
MLPTPSTSHVNYERIYEPSEDSYLLLDTLSTSTENSFLQCQFPSGSATPLVLEVGPGSGVVLAFVTAHAKHIFGRSDVATLGIDVNEFACKATKQTVEVSVKEDEVEPGVFLNAVWGDLTNVIRPGSIDVLIFNPPYVPSEALPALPENSFRDSFERDILLSSLATDGGIDGMETTDRLLAELPRVLIRRGVAYILLCAQNKPDEVMDRIRAWPEDQGKHWCAEKVGSSGRKAGWERLCVVRIWRAE